MRISALVTRIITQFIRDKRTLALMIIAPMFVLFLVSLTFSGEVYKPKIAVYNLPEVMESKLTENGAQIKKIPLEEANILIQNKELDAILKGDSQGTEIILEGSDPSVSKSVLDIFKSMNEKGKEEERKPKISFLYGSKDMELFDKVGPILIGFFIFFFVFLIAGIAFLRERSSGTLEKLLSTPLRRGEIVLGYVLGFGLFTTFQAAMISWFSIKVLGIMMKGAFLYVLLITLLLSMTALTLGILFSTFANNELQMMQFIPIIVIPQVFFSGLFNLNSFSKYIQVLSKMMPLSYGANALEEIMIRGKGWESIASDVYVLLIFSGIFILLNILSLKRYRRI